MGARNVLLAAQTGLLRLRRSRRVFFLALVLVILAVYSYDVRINKQRLQLWVRSSLLPDVLSIQFTNSANRAEARIPRVAMSRAFAGLDPAYVELELERDKELNGGYNVTLDHRSHLPPASAFYNIRVASPEKTFSHQYAGLDCIDRYPLAHCPFPGICPPDYKSNSSNRPCAVWRTGYPNTLERWIENGGLRRESTARKRTLDWDRPGRWIDDLWHPWGSLVAPPEPYHFFTPEEIHQCFKGKRILFQGDSMVRQLCSTCGFFQRIVNMSFHGQPSYQTFPNGTDNFQPDCPNGQCSFPEDALYTIIYSWHDERNETKNLAKLKDWKIDMTVHGIVYWIAWDVDLADSRESISRLFDSGEWKGAFSWYTTPYHSHNVRWQYDERNTRMRELLSFVRARHPDVNARIIPTDRVVRPENGCPVIRDRQPIDSQWLDVHYMCDYDNVQLHEPIKPGLQNLKAPLDWDARDVMNFNVLQLWLNSVCGPSS